MRRAVLVAVAVMAVGFEASVRGPRLDTEERNSRAPRIIGMRDDDIKDPADTYANTDGNEADDDVKDPAKTDAMISVQVGGAGDELPEDPGALVEEATAPSSVEFGSKPQARAPSGAPPVFAGTTLVEKKDKSTKANPPETAALPMHPTDSAVDGRELKLLKDVGFESSPAAHEAGVAPEVVGSAGVASDQLPASEKTDPALYNTNELKLLKGIGLPDLDEALPTEKPADVSHKTWRKAPASHKARKFFKGALWDAEHTTLMFVDYLNRHFGETLGFASVKAPGYANEVDANAGTGSLIISVGIAFLAIVVYVVARYRDATKQPGFLMFMFCCMFASLIFFVIAIAGFVLRMSK